MFLPVCSSDTALAVFLLVDGDGNWDSTVLTCAGDFVLTFVTFLGGFASISDISVSSSTLVSES